MIENVAICTVLILAFALIMGWKPWKKKVATPPASNDKMNKSYDQLIAQVVKVNDFRKLALLERDIDSFFDHYFGQADLSLLKEYYKQLVSEWKTAEKRLEDENSYV